MAISRNRFRSTNSEQETKDYGNYTFSIIGGDEEKPKSVGQWHIVPHPLAALCSPHLVGHYNDYFFVVGSDTGPEVVILKRRTDAKIEPLPTISYEISVQFDRKRPQSWELQRLKRLTIVCPLRNDMDEIPSKKKATSPLFPSPHCWKNAPYQRILSVWWKGGNLSDGLGGTRLEGHNVPSKGLRQALSHTSGQEPPTPNPPMSHYALIVRLTHKKNHRSTNRFSFRSKYSTVSQFLHLFFSALERKEDCKGDLGAVVQAFDRPDEKKILDNRSSERTDRPRQPAAGWGQRRNLGLRMEGGEYGTSPAKTVLFGPRCEYKGLTIGNKKLGNLRFEGDIVLIVGHEVELKSMLEDLKREGEKAGLEVNTLKTKIMSNRLPHNTHFQIDGKRVEGATDIIYLGRLIFLEDETAKEVDRRIYNGWKKYWSIKYMFKAPIDIKLKREVYNSCALPVMTFGSQTWSLSRTIASRLEDVRRAKGRSMLGVYRSDRIRNDTLRGKTGLKELRKEAC
ncbi:hypothetical protein AAG570_001400 [Ranatra chinensis]|uniref:Reverse transcriptase domain-containing protein n=1 Tax=Ranatra chinensis TaxID=642074 RepID=A0ABD0YCG6_9HEMI